MRDALLEAWADPSRAYHDLRHLTEVLDRLDVLADAGEGFPDVPVRLAAWFHDAVYDGRPGAEERSARWAEEALAGLLPEGTVATVARLVRLTETHRPAADDPAGRALCDADLGVLAAPSPRYDAYAADVRREYAAVPDAAFRAGRSAVLGDLLSRPVLFHTAYAREHWEPRARANLSREVAELVRPDGPEGPPDRTRGAIYPPTVS